MLAAELSTTSFLAFLPPARFYQRGTLNLNATTPFYLTPANARPLPLTHAMGGETLFEKERRIRRKVDSVFNKKESDFERRGDWDNYLEEKEDIAFNLIEGFDEKETWARLAEYERKNADTIISTTVKQAEAARQEAQQRLTDGEEEAVSSITAAAADAAVEQPQGHDNLQYAAAAPGPSLANTRPAPTVIEPAAAARSSIWPKPDPDLTDKQRHARMAKASGWDPGIAAARAHQQAFSSIFA